MYIAPNTVLRILHNCPLDNTYDHTIGFASKQEQADYFSGLVKYERGQLSYQRYSTNVITVELVADNLYDCNYLMFQNSAFGNKWFYAFITYVEYVSNNVSRITYELDDMQTWFFDWSFGQCFVEREHSVLDRQGDNTQPEGLETGPTIYEKVDLSGYFADWRICVFQTAEWTSYPINPGFWGRTFHQAELNVYNPYTDDGVNSLKQYLLGAQLLRNTGIVAGFFMYPTAFIPERGDSLTQGMNNVKTYSIRISKGDGKLGSYTPKNKKLLCWPYNYLFTTTQQGSGVEYRYEYFNSADCTFDIVGDISCKPVVTLLPTGYKNSGNANYNERLAIQNFPVCTFADNDFGAKLVQGALMVAMTAAGNLSGDIAVAKGTEAQWQAVQHEIPNKGQYTTEWAKGHQARMQAVHDQSVAAKTAQREAGLNAQARVLGDTAISMTHTNVNSTTFDSGSLFNLGAFDFQFYHMHIREEYARIIDDYFSAFGYKTNRLKYPNWNSRPHWNYVKTANCVVHGSVPADAMHHICAIHNNGITYWKKGEEVGNYTLDNSPT